MESHGFMLLAIGFVVSLVFSWIYELTPAGLQLESELASGNGAYQGPDRRRRRLRRISERPGGAGKSDHGKGGKGKAHHGSFPGLSSL